MRTLKLVMTPPSAAGQKNEDIPDVRDYPLKLKVGGRPLDQMPDCRFDEIRDQALLFDLAASTPAEAAITPIRPLPDVRTVQARLFFIPRNLPTEAVLKAISPHGRSADPSEFLAFAGQHPSVPLGVPIVTLGWSCQVDRWTKYAMLTTDVRKRRILRSACPPSWPPAWRYLIIVS